MAESEEEVKDWGETFNGLKVKEYVVDEVSTSVEA